VPPDVYVTTSMLKLVEPPADALVEPPTRVESPDAVALPPCPSSVLVGAAPPPGLSVWVSPLVCVSVLVLVLARVLVWSFASVSVSVSVCVGGGFVFVGVVLVVLLVVVEVVVVVVEVGVVVLVVVVSGDPPSPSPGPLGFEPPGSSSGGKDEPGGGLSDMGKYGCRGRSG
jgi:hypothetical protein